MASHDTTRCISLVLVTIAVRCVGLAFTWDTIRSQDMDGWMAVADALRKHENPYASTTFLNWPPLWMQCIWLVDRISEAVHLPFVVVTKAFLIAGDAVLMVCLFVAWRFFYGPGSSLKPLLFGFACNPVSILLTCIHGNFDVLVAILSLLGILFAARFLVTGETLDRLSTALSIGLGVVAKTIPVVLLPFLFVRGTERPRKESLFAILLALLPVILSMGPIYVLNPGAIEEKVLGYRALPGWYGVSGIADTFGLYWFSRKVYPALFYLAILTGVIGLIKVFREQQNLGPTDILLVAGIVLLAIPTLGPGFGLQYSYWALPLVTLTLGARERAVREAARAYLTVLAATYIVLYGIGPSLGQYAVPLASSILGVPFETRGLTPAESTLFTLPLFAASLHFILIAIAVLKRNWQEKIS